MNAFTIREQPLGNQITLEDILDNLSFLDDWEDRYRYIIDLGKQVLPFPDSLKTEDRIIHGCQSQVWLETDYDESTGKLYIAVDSDAHIVKGLAAIVITAYNGKSPQAIVDFDIEALFDKLDLIRHLSPTRGNGLRSMVQRIRETAARYC